MDIDAPNGAVAPAEPPFEEIEAAVMESERGRRFLAEFARRNRHADTERLLAAIGRLETSLDAQPPQPAAPARETELTGLKRAICDMAREIAAAKREIAAIKTPDGARCEIAGATAELDAIVGAAELATSEILEAAEQIQEVAWTLREAGADGSYCDALDERATAIYTACSFQDLTGQRTTKVVRVLQTLEARINTLAELWSGTTTDAEGTAQRSAGDDPEAGLLNGPATDGEGVGQDDVDRMMVGVWAEASEESRREDGIAAIESEDCFARPAPGASVARADERADTLVAAGVAAGVANAGAPNVAGNEGPGHAALSQKDYEAMFG